GVSLPAPGLHPAPHSFPTRRLFRSYRGGDGGRIADHDVPFPYRADRGLPLVHPALHVLNKAVRREDAALCDTEAAGGEPGDGTRSEEHTSELQSRFDLVCRLLLEKN